MALTFARRTLGAVVLAVACCVLPAAARAEAADAGQRAFDRGDFAEALRVWQQRANAGDPHAQLGMLRAQGAYQPPDGSCSRLHALTVQRLCLAGHPEDAASALD